MILFHLVEYVDKLFIQRTIGKVRGTLSLQCILIECLFVGLRAAVLGD